MMRIAITGSNGFIGSELRTQLLAREDTVFQLIRQDAATPTRRKTDVLWSPSQDRVETDKLQDLDAFVHLAGQNIASGRWTDARKKLILESRTRGTDLIARTLASLPRKPRVLISASAVGFYGDRGDEVLTESSPPGRGFLPDVCRQWEAATAPAEQAGIRVVHLRIGAALSPAGGIIRKVLPLFRKGLGGKLGRGNQYLSWISLPDLIAAIIHCIENDSLRGPVNATAENPVTNLEFTRTLGRILARPTLFPAPAFALRLALGQFADAVLLASARAVPQKLSDSPFNFKHDQLDSALRAVLPPAIVRG